MLRPGVASTAIEVLELHVQPATPSTLHRGDCGRGAVDEDRASLPLSEALERWFTEPAEAEALAAWDAISVSGRVGFLDWEKSERNRLYPAKRGYLPDGGIAEYPPDLLPHFIAANDAVEARARRATEALKLGRLKLEFRRSSGDLSLQHLDKEFWNDRLSITAWMEVGPQAKIRRLIRGPQLGRDWLRQTLRFTLVKAVDTAGSSKLSNAAVLAGDGAVATAEAVAPKRRGRRPGLTPALKLAQEIALEWFEEEGTPVPASGEQAKLVKHIQEKLAAKNSDASDQRLRELIPAWAREWVPK